MWRSQCDNESQKERRERDKLWKRLESCGRWQFLRGGLASHCYRFSAYSFLASPVASARGDDDFANEICAVAAMTIMKETSSSCKELQNQQRKERD